VLKEKQLRWFAVTKKWLEQDIVKGIKTKIGRKETCGMALRKISEELRSRPRRRWFSQVL
jgi:hypothetical protein